MAAVTTQRFLDVAAHVSQHFGAEYVPPKQTDNRKVSDDPTKGQIFWEIGFPKANPAPPGTPVVLTLWGTQGSGKTTKFKELCGDEAGLSEPRQVVIDNALRVGRAARAASGGSRSLQTDTRKRVLAKCRPPFQNISVYDTPGVGTAIEPKDGFELRESLVRKPVNLMAVVQALPTQPRAQPLIDNLAPIDKIMSCATFQTDADGCFTPDVPKRAKVFLILTYRDISDNGAGIDTSLANLEQLVSMLRETYPWIGSVAVVDTRVDVKWLLSTVAVAALCEPAREYSIPINEFSCRFPIAHELSRDHRDALEQYLRDFRLSFDQAIQTLELEKQNRDTARDGYYVDRVGPVVDCCLRFLDDLFESTTLEALAALEGVPQDELFAGTDEDINVWRIERWNSVKAYFGGEYQSNKQAISRAYPERDEHAIYKKCNFCDTCWCKPKGCDFHSFCGYSGGGNDTLPFSYDFKVVKSADGSRITERRFEIIEARQPSFFELAAFEKRRRQYEVVKRHRFRLWGSTKEDELDYDPEITLNQQGLSSHGLVWTSTGTNKPTKGRPYRAHAALEAALTAKFAAAGDSTTHRFSTAEWRAFGIHDLSIDHYVVINGNYIRPVSSGCGKQINWQTMIPLTKAEMVALHLIPPEVPMQQIRDQLVTPTPTSRIVRVMSEICTRLGLEPSTHPREMINISFSFIGIEQPARGTYNEKAVTLQIELNDLDEKLEHIFREGAGYEEADLAAMKTNDLPLSERVTKAAEELGMEDEVEAARGLKPKVTLLFNACFPGENSAKFTATNYLRLYQQHAMKQSFESVQGAVREILVHWGQNKGAPLNAIESFCDALIQDCVSVAGTVGADKRVGDFVVKLWTSDMPLTFELTAEDDATGVAPAPVLVDTRFYSVLQEVVRNDAIEMRFLLRSAIVFCRGLNACLTQRHCNRADLVWPGGPTAPEAPLRVPGQNGLARSTEAWTTYRTTGMPRSELEQDGLCNILAHVQVADDGTNYQDDKGFRTTQFLASSFMIDSSLKFLEDVKEEYEAVLLKIHIDPTYLCKHVGYLEKSTSVRGEYEHLYPPFSAFSVRSVTPPARDWHLTGVRNSREDCWVIELDAAPDNLTARQDLALQSWT